MTTAEDVIKQAERWVGFVEGPRNNESPFGAWYGLNFQPSTFKVDSAFAFGRVGFVISSQVMSHSFSNVGVISNQADSSVTQSTEQTSYFVGLVAMVYCKAVAVLVDFSAKSAHTFLSLKHHAVLFKRKAVSIKKVSGTLRKTESVSISQSPRSILLQNSFSVSLIILGVIGRIAFLLKSFANGVRSQTFFTLSVLTELAPTLYAARSRSAFQDVVFAQRFCFFTSWAPSLFHTRMLVHTRSGV